MLIIYNLFRVLIIIRKFVSTALNCTAGIATRLN